MTSPSWHQVQQVAFDREVAELNTGTCSPQEIMAETKRLRQQYEP